MTDLKVQDLSDRVEMLESLVKKLNNSYNNLKLQNCSLYEKENSIAVSDATTIQIGVLGSVVGAVEIYILFNFDCSQDCLATIKQNNRSIGSGKLFANSAGMLQILGGICAQNGGIVIDLTNAQNGGTIKNLKVFLRGKATFNFVGS